MTITDVYIIIGAGYAIMSTWLIIRRDEETEEEKNRFRDLMKSIPDSMRIPAAFLMTLITIFLVAVGVVGWPALSGYDVYRHFKDKNKPS